MKIILGGVPLSVNKLYGTRRDGGKYLTKEALEQKRTLGWLAKEAMLKARIHDPLRGDIDMVIDFYFPDKKRRDSDNPLKLLWDSMTGIVYEDDSQIMTYCVRKHFDKENPRTEISIFTDKVAC